jgi:hypothetical protein
MNRFSSVAQPDASPDASPYARSSPAIFSRWARGGTSGRNAGGRIAPISTHGYGGGDYGLISVHGAASFNGATSPTMMYQVIELREALVRIPQVPVS